MAFFTFFLVSNTKLSSQKCRDIVENLKNWANGVFDGTEGILRIRMCRFDLCTHTHVILVHCCLTRGGGPNKSLYLYFCNGEGVAFYGHLALGEEK